MAEIILLSLLFLICVFVFGFGKPKTKRDDIEAIALKDLSVIWLVHNKNFDSEVNVENKDEPVEIQIDTAMEMSEADSFKNCNEETSANQEEFQQILSMIAENINKANEKGIYEIFSLSGKVYVHTSGLGRILKETFGMVEPGEIKDEIRKTGERLFEGGIAEDKFSKFIWEAEDGHTGKSLYLEIQFKYLPAGTLIEDTSNIIKMEKI